MTYPKLFFPPNPDPESWKTDTPNEGIQLDFYEDENITMVEIVEFKLDYHGMFILPNDVDLLMTDMGRLPSPYKEAATQIQSLPTPTKEAVIQILTDLGFREVKEYQGPEEEVIWTWA